MSVSLPRTSSRARRAGFTLIELSLVIAIIGILAVFLVPKGLDLLYRAKVTACKANLRHLHDWYVLYREDKKSLPRESGVKNFLSIWNDAIVEKTDSNAEAFTCPEPDLPGGLYDEAKGDFRDGKHWFEPWDAVDGSYTTYAGRDVKAHPLRSLGGEEPLVCDDNDGGPNHRLGVTLVLLANGSIREIRHADLKKQGILPEDATNLEIGPESPVPELQKMTRD